MQEAEEEEVGNDQRGGATTLEALNGWTVDISEFQPPSVAQ